SNDEKPTDNEDVGPAFEGRLVFGRELAESRHILDQLRELWRKYLQTIGPSIVRHYRNGKLDISAIDWVLKSEGGELIRVMEKMTVEYLIAEELEQDSNL